MDKKRIFRALVCLVLICALLVNASPIKAKAITPTTWIWLEASILIASAWAGLGLSPVDEGSDIIADVLTDCQNFLTLNYDFVSDDEKIKVWSTGNPDLPYMIDAEVIQAVRDWAFETFAINTETGEISSVVEEEVLVEIPEGFASYNGYILPVIPDYMLEYLEDYPYLYLRRYLSSGSTYLTATNVLPYVEDYSDDGDIVFRHPDATYCICAYNSDNQSWGYVSVNTGNGGYILPTTRFNDILWVSHDLVNVDTGSVYMSGSSPITSDYTTTEKETTPLYTSTAFIAPPEDDLPVGYPVWAENIEVIGAAVTGTDSDVTVYPIGIGPDVSGTLGMPQEDIWAGVSTGTITDSDTDTDVGTGTDSKDYSGILGQILSTLNAVRDYQVTGNVQAVGKLDLISGALGDTNAELEEQTGLLSALLTTGQVGFEDVVNNIIALPGAVGDELVGVESLLGGISDILTGTQVGVLTYILDAVLAVPKAIAECIAAIFIPAPGYIDAKIANLTDKYQFVSQITESGLKFREWFLNLGEKPPIIYIDLGAARGFYHMGGKVVLMDMTWYEEYKPTVDGIISSFLWLWFIWRILLSLPGIIQGTSGFWNKVDSDAGANYAPDPKVRWDPHPRGFLESGDRSLRK